MMTLEKHDDNSDNDDFIYTTLHREYWYLMQLACVYPDLRKGTRKNISILYMILMAFAAAYTLMVCTYTFILIPEDILIASQGLHFCILQIICLAIATTANISRREYADIHRVIGIGPVEYDEETKNGMTGIKEKLRIRKKYLLISITVYIAFAGFLTAILAPFIDSLISGGIKKDIYSPGGVSLNLPLALWSPFGTHTNIGYVLSIIMEIVCASEVTTVVVGGDITLLVMTQYLTMELLLLTLALKRLPERTIRLYKTRYNIDSNQIVDITKLRENENLRKCYAYCLKESAVHHKKIIRAFAGINKILSMPIFVAYFSGSIMIAICGIVMIFGNGEIGSLITAFILGFGEILNMLLISWCGEQIGDANEKFMIALYSTKWYYSPKQEAKTLQIMMCRSQRPLTLFAGGIVPLNFETFSNVMNSAYSYFNLVYASKEGK